MGKPLTHGLYTERTKACAHCGQPFTARSPRATYCGNSCRIAGTMYGRMTYGQKRPRVLGITKS